MTWLQLKFLTKLPMATTFLRDRIQLQASAISHFSADDAAREGLARSVRASSLIVRP
jgi:hypothetical protein